MIYLIKNIELKKDIQRQIHNVRFDLRKKYKLEYLTDIEIDKIFEQQ